MARWKAYWIMRGVERYLAGRDAVALVIVTAIVDQFEKEQAEGGREAAEK